MADTPPPAPARRGGWSLTHPGAKEYLTVGGVTLVIFLIYKWYKNKTAAAAAAQPAASTTGTSGTAAGSPQGPSPTGLSVTQFLAAMTNQQASAAPAPAAPAPAPMPSTPSSPVPAVAGQTNQQAASTLNNAGFLTGTGGKAAPSGLPAGLSASSKVSSQSPSAGTRVVYGSAYWPVGTTRPFVDIN